MDRQKVLPCLDFRSISEVIAYVSRHVKDGVTLRVVCIHDVMITCTIGIECISFGNEILGKPSSSITSFLTNDESNISSWLLKSKSHFCQIL